MPWMLYSSQSYSKFPIAIPPEMIQCTTVTASSIRALCVLLLLQFATTVHSRNDGGYLPSTSRNASPEPGEISNKITPHPIDSIDHQFCQPSRVENSRSRGDKENLPARFLKAAKGDPAEGWRRYRDTQGWRQQERMDNILYEQHPNFYMIKENYPHFFHLRGRYNEPVYYEKPAMIKLKFLKSNGVTIDMLLRHYAFITEFMWARVEPSKEGKSIYVIDLEGIRPIDFVGEVISFIRKAADFTGKHYPERSRCIFVVNVPLWFNVIWNVVKPMVDPVTLQKIYILRGKKVIHKALCERIPLENIPPDYGGYSMPLGHSPEENILYDWIKRNQCYRGTEVEHCHSPVLPDSPKDNPTRYANQYNSRYGNDKLP